MVCLYFADLYINEVYHHHSSYTKIIARYVTHISDELEPNKVVCYGQHIWTRTCIVYHKLCEIHQVFQREYITKLIIHFVVFKILLRLSIVTKQFVVKQTFLCQKVLIWNNLVSYRLMTYAHFILFYKTYYFFLISQFPLQWHQRTSYI